MFKIERTITSTAEQIEIVPTGDWHYNSPNCRLKKVRELIAYVKEDKDRYVVLMGDLWDSIIPTDKRFEPEGEYSMLDDQYTVIRDLLLPIKDRILVAVTGNHEWKLHSSGHGDLTKRLCTELGIPYGGFSCYLKIKMSPASKKKSLLIYVHHGWSASRKTGAVINAVESLIQFYDADVYLVGHSHKLSSTKQVRINWKGKRDVLFCNTGTFLETASWGQTGYSERAGYPPLRIGCLKIKYYPKREKCYVTE